MIYYKDPIQLRELSKNAQRIIADTSQKDMESKIDQYQREIEYWTEHFPVQLQTWEDDGGFINEQFLTIVYENYVE